MRQNLATLLTRDQIVAALNHIMANNINLRPSTKFDLEYNGRTFPPKEVIREAARLAGMDPDKYRLNGGPPTNDPLVKLGFTVAPKALTNPSGPRELIDALKAFMDSTPVGTSFGPYRFIEKNTDLAFGTPGGSHDPLANPGYIFSSDAQELLFRFRSLPNFYISVENVRRRTQLANLALVVGKTFDSNGVIQLRDNYRITVGSAQSSQTSRDAMLRSGFSADDIILTYEEPVADAKEIIDRLLEWAEIRQKAKDLIKAEQRQSPRGAPGTWPMIRML